MKSPITGRFMPLMTMPATAEYRGEKFEYTALYYHCEVSGEHFTTETLTNLSLVQVYRQYYEKHGGPIPEDLKQMCYTL